MHDGMAPEWNAPKVDLASFWVYDVFPKCCDEGGGD